MIGTVKIKHNFGFVMDKAASIESKRPRIFTMFEALSLDV